MGLHIVGAALHLWRINVMKKCILSLFWVVSLGASESVAVDIQKESYAIGASTGNYVINQVIRQKKLGLRTDNGEIIKGFKDAVNGKLQLDDDQIITLLNTRVDRLNALKKEELKMLRSKSLEKGRKYLADNKSKKGVKKTKSGLLYEVLKEGNGKSVKSESIVVINYRAQLIDGTVFDDTYKRKSPAHLSMVNVIDGLKEGLKLMKEGSKYRLTIPSELAYGEEGLENIPPNSVVIFEIELVKVIAPDEFQKMMHQKADITIDKKSK